MRFPLTRIERIVIFAGCGIVFCGGLAFFAKLILFPSISYGFIGSLWALGTMLISATVLARYEAEDDMKHEEQKRLQAKCAEHPEQFGMQGPDFEEEIVHQRYAPVESGPLAPLTLAHTGTRRLSRGGVQVGENENDDFGVFAGDQRPDAVRFHGTKRDNLVGEDEPSNGFEAEAFTAHLPLKGELVGAK